jgi:hypothetical protein
MIVKALEDFDSPSHKVSKGGIADLPERIAVAGIEAGLLEASSIEEKLKSSETREMRKRPRGRPTKDAAS